MRPNARAQNVSTSVRAAIQRAAEAVSEQDIERMVEWLGAGVSIYEEHPTQVHEPLSHLRDLLVWIRAAAKPMRDARTT